MHTQTLDNVACKAMIAVLKWPDTGGSYIIDLQRKPNQSAYEAWSGSYSSPLGDYYLLTMQRNIVFLDRWSIQLLHRSRFYGELIIMRIDTAPHRDHVTGEKFTTDKPHIHIYREDWKIVGYPRHDSHAKYAPYVSIELSDSWSYIEKQANISKTRMFRQERLL